MGTDRADPTRPWLLLRGLARDARHWGDFPARWSACCGRPVVLLDLPGNGRRWQERSPSSVAEMTDDLRRQWLLHEPGGGRLDVIALSLGGMVAVDWAQRFPGEIGRCVLINTSLPPHARWMERLRPAGIAAALRLLLPASDRQWERTVLRLTSNRRPVPAELLDRWTAWRGEARVSPRSALAQLMAAARFRAHGVRPACELLLVASRGDHLVNPACSARIAAAWQVPLRMHPDAGHDLPLDDPAWLLAELARSEGLAPLRD